MNEEKTNNTQQPAQAVQAASVAPAPQPVPQPATEKAPAPQPVPQPAQEATPVPTPVVQAEPAPQATQQAATPQASAAVVPEVAPQQAAPVPPKGEDIQAAPALNPIANNPQPAVTTAPTPQATQQATFAPSNPLQTDINTNVGFVAVGENLKKKKNVPLIVAIVVFLLAGLGALGYFVIYPYVVKQLTKPDKIYNAVIDNAFKELNANVISFAHNRVIYNAELQIDTNIEQLKDLAGFTYSGDFGIDTANKNIQVGVDIKDADSQEHSANIYVKNDREYLRLSSYRELIYLGAIKDRKETWDKLYEIFDDINEENATYLLETFETIFKNSIVQSKLSKEEASITINGQKYKVLNNKYTIDNETITSMYKSILDGIKDDDKFIEILAKVYNVSKDELVKELDSIEVPEKILEDNEVYYFSIYTYSIKTTVVGFELSNGDNYARLYTMDGYTEFKINSTRENIETGKDETIDFTAIGRKSDGKTIVNVTLNENEIAHFIVSAWDEKEIKFSYEIKAEEQNITGDFELLTDKNNDRVKYNSKFSIKIDKDYLKLNMALTNDWTSEVSNINASTAKTLDENELQNKINEFIETLKNTPLANVFTTISGEIDKSVLDYRTDTSKGIDNCSPGTNCINGNDVIEDNPSDNDGNSSDHDYSYNFDDDNGNDI